jgi:hypothetical protein
MAVELRNRLGTGLGLKRSLPATLIFDYPTIEAIAGYLVKEVLSIAQPANGGTAETQQPVETTPISSELTSTPAEIDELSDEEVEAMLLKKLADI